MSNVIDFEKAKFNLQMDKLAKVIADDLAKSSANDNNPKLPEYSTDFALMVTRDILNFLEELGYNLTVDENLIYDIMLIIESNKSMLYRLHGENHPMHQVGKDLFEIDNPYKTLEEILNDLLEE